MTTVENQIPKTPQQQLAQDIALILGDTQNLLLYETYTRKYPEAWLRLLLAEVRSVPEHRIKKSRAAFFHYLIKRYGTHASGGFRS